MKNAIMMVAAMGMFGGALAESTTVVQPVSATVTNVCTYNIPDVSDVNGQVFNQPNKVLGTYNALGTLNATVEMGNFYIFRCTSGTSWNVPSATGPGTISLTNSTAGSQPLVVNYSITTFNDPDTANGDVHAAGAVFTANAGQWRARAGSYSGNLTVVINYN